MVEFLILASLALAVIVVFGVVASVFGLVLWLIFLPFRIMGWIFKGFALLLAVPFVAVFGVIAFLVFGAGMLVFLFPLLPIALLAVLAWWLVRRNRQSAATVAR